MRGASPGDVPSTWDPPATDPDHPLPPPVGGVDGLVASVVRWAAFLERTGRHTVDLEFARTSLHPLTATAARMPPDELSRLREQLQAIARYVRRDSVSARLLSLLDGLLERGTTTTPG